MTITFCPLLKVILSLGGKSLFQEQLTEADRLWPKTWHPNCPLERRRVSRPTSVAWQGQGPL